MKKFTAILISCSLALAATALAQQDEQPEKGKKHPEEKTQTNQVKPGKGQQGGRQGGHGQGSPVPGQQPGTVQSEGTPKMHGGGKGKNKEPMNANAEPNGSPNANAEGNINAGGKGKHGGQGKGERNATATSPAPMDGHSPAPTGAQTNVHENNNLNAEANKQGRKGKKLDSQTVQKIKTEHSGFRAQPKPEKVPAVTFNQSHRIEGAEKWQGEKYTVFRSYHPEMHDHDWYHSHYTRVELIGGGYYYWNGGYWFPAWGYDPGAAYYVYDGPIYVGARAEPPDQVIADVQAELQEEGYYTGEVDGLLGPLTRQALTEYQADNGLYTTAVIDEPTLDSLGLG